MSMERYRGHFLRPDYQYSFPAGKADEGLYQVLQLILQKKNLIARPEIYDALTDKDLSSLQAFLGISFAASAKNVHPDAVARLRQAYDGDLHIIPATQEHLLFTLATLENTTSVLHFVACACARSLIVTKTGTVGSLELDRSNPYFVFYFVIPQRSAHTDFSLESCADAQLKRGIVASSEDLDPYETVERVNIQLINIVRSYIVFARASSGNLCGLGP